MRQQAARRLRIALVIAWDEGDYTSQQYKLYDIEHSKAFAAKPSKVYPRAQKYIYDAREGREVQVLLLEPVVQEIASAAAGKWVDDRRTYRGQ